MKMMQNGSAAGHSKRRVLLALSLTLVVLCIAVGGTIAWLTDTTSTLTNTFLTSKIDIELKETTTGYKMIPGTAISKDPKVTVKDGSEACYLFVEVNKSANFSAFMDYSMATGWTQLKNAGGTDVPGVFYREVVAVTEDTSFAVLSGNQVTVKSAVTETDLTNLGTNYPTLTFKAYAVQSAGVETPIAAWNLRTP